MKTKTQPRLNRGPVPLTLHKELTEHEWSQVFHAREGALPLSQLPVRIRELAQKPMMRLWGAALFHDRGAPPPENDPETIREFVRMLDPAERVRQGVSGGYVAAAAFAGNLNTWALEGFAELPDSPDQIAATDELSNFLPAPVLQALDMHSLKPVAKGGTAEDTQLAVFDLGTWRLIRLARRASVDEQDLLNDVSGSIRKSMAQLGRAAARAWLDLAWATILTNPTLDQDETTLFHADHGNTGTAVLSDTAIGAGCAAIRRQVIVTPEGQVQHINLQPAYLVVPPELERVAREALRLMMLDDPQIDLQLRVESRMTNLGVKNPLTGEVVTGSPTNWLISADNAVAPWLLQGILQGVDKPKIRVGEYNVKDTPGQYGLAVDVSWNIACKAADFRGCYFSTGTGA